MGVGFDKIFLLYNPATYETADVISTYVYRKGLINQSYSYSSAVGLFNSVINFAFIIATNKISKQVSETSLW
jgi:putative aldouronate transport system permease protein